MKKSRRVKSVRNAPKTFGELLIESMQEAVAIQRGELEPGALHRYPLTVRQASAAPAPMVGAAARAGAAGGPKRRGRSR